MGSESHADIGREATRTSGRTRQLHEDQHQRHGKRDGDEPSGQRVDRARRRQSQTRQAQQPRTDDRADREGDGGGDAELATQGAGSAHWSLPDTSRYLSSSAMTLRPRMPA